MGNNEIATRDEHTTDLTVMPPRQPMQATARQVLMDHAELASMAYEFATKLVGTKMVPVRFRNAPEEATAAILYGAELGLGPISALQNIFEVHGSPGIYARTAQALLEAKGFHFKTTEHTNGACTVQGWYPHHNPEVDDFDEESRFTIEDAQLAGWAPTELDSDKGGVLVRGVRYQANGYGKLDGNEQYITKPRQMLWAKCMMEVCRHLSPATLLGIAYSVEELESEHASHNPIGGGSSAPVPTTGEPLTVEEILSAAPPERPQPANAVPDPDGGVESWTEVNPQSAPEPAPEPEPEPEPEPVKNKRASKREQTAAKSADTVPGNATAGEQIPGKPKGHTTRVEAALAKAHAAQAGKSEQEGTEVPETTPAAEPEPQTAPVETPEPTEDPSEPEPTADDSAVDDAVDAADWMAQQSEVAEPVIGEDPAWTGGAKDAVNSDVDQSAARRAAEVRKQEALDRLRAEVEEQEAAKAAAKSAVTERVKAPENWDGLKPATREQLQELAKCIAAAGFQPTPEGREEWFAWLTQEVEREVTANNQLARKEIVAVIATMQADQQT